MELYNSLTRKKEPLQLFEPGKLSLYVCGLTVYDRAHIGHLRTMLVFDLLVRFATELGMEVTYVRNITDVDDKIIQRAQEKGLSTEALTKQVIAEIQKETQSLGLLDPTHEPKASEYIQSMINMIELLLDKEYAYIAKNGDVCFSVKKYEDYGKLSGQNIEALLKEYRVAGEGKAMACDFVLWKQTKPGEPSWSSPWGEGRPGWHIECSAMSTDLLGESFDVHGGGVDLKFPHHENEIAQSVCAKGGEYAKCWMHVGHLHVNGEKMSKSLGNFVTIEEALKRYHPEVLKLFLLKTHYRQPFNYSEAGVIEAQHVLRQFYLALWGKKTAAVNKENPWWQRFIQAFEDDLNAAQALSIMHQVSGLIMEGEETDLYGGLLLEMGKLFGILQVLPEVFLTTGVDAKAVNDLIKKRESFRKEKNFQAADAIRDELFEQGIEVEDTQAGSRWYVRHCGIYQ